MGHEENSDNGDNLWCGAFRVLMEESQIPLVAARHRVDRITM